ncbi:MAG: gamma-glutamyltransferase [Gammaproteobacteria bacterium]|nr:gamma-glutamyltransferase [Gammaproteobacteria bacterium]
MNSLYHRSKRYIAFAMWVASLALADISSALASQASPELPSTWITKDIVFAKHDMVVAAHPLAVEAGQKTLSQGGSAIDAAIAVQMVLNLVEPQSSGIGGGAFLLHYQSKRKHLDTYDGRETAPMAATPDLFIGPDGQPLPFSTAVIGGRSVGTPGLLRLLEDAHREHGRLPWAALFKPAIKLARNGFPISPRLATALAGAAAICQETPAKDYFCNSDGTPKTAGTVLRNPEFAQTLVEIAAGGAKRFYQPPIAQDIVNTVRNHPTNPGLLTLADLAQYRAKKRTAVCGSYRNTWEICGMNMPSSGGATVLQTLGILEHFDVGALPPETAPAVHLISEAYRLAYADRAKYMADSDFVVVPVEGLLNKDYLQRRAALIDLNKSMGVPEPGVPPGAMAKNGLDNSRSLPSTSHVSIIDRHGNVVSMTTSIESAFGSHQFVRGFLLNNQLTDFSFTSVDSSGNPIVNRVEPGKRPRSSMAPTIVFDRAGNVRMVIGSPGGSNIIQYVTKTIIGVLDWNLDIQQAINLGNFGAQTTATTVLEQDSPVATLVAELQALGHTVSVTQQNSGLHGITVQNDHSGCVGRLAGGADPRREGVAKGDSQLLTIKSNTSVQQCD